MQLGESKKVYVVIAAAGSGERLGGDIYKALVPIKGKPMLQWVLEAFDSVNISIVCINVVIPEKADVAVFEDLIKGLGSKRRFQTTLGGDIRQLSVYRGIMSLECANEDIVVVHDGARPFVRVELIENVVNRMEKENVVVPIIPITDTIKILGEDYIVGTLPREKMGAVQTPQAFRFGLYKRALNWVNLEMDIFTDEASLFERAGIRVAYVDGDRFNIKITYKEDLIIAEYLADKIIVR